ncbi:hypothetical protein NMY22_g15627 [Coprinellus aureogranulatus]|nr:hypothetical protein NMY22_g15627 [Coprinellus aureogranulatus]
MAANGHTYHIWEMLFRRCAYAPPSSAGPSPPVLSAQRVRRQLWSLHAPKSSSSSVALSTIQNRGTHFVSPSDFTFQAPSCCPDHLSGCALHLSGSSQRLLSPNTRRFRALGPPPSTESSLSLESFSRSENYPSRSTSSRFWSPRPGTLRDEMVDGLVVVDEKVVCKAEQVDSLRPAPSPSPVYYRAKASSEQLYARGSGTIPINTRIPFPAGVPIVDETYDNSGNLRNPTTAPVGARFQLLNDPTAPLIMMAVYSFKAWFRGIVPPPPTPVLALIRLNPTRRFRGSLSHEDSSSNSSYGYRHGERMAEYCRRDEANRPPGSWAHRPCRQRWAFLLPSWNVLVGLRPRDPS